MIIKHHTWMQDCKAAERRLHGPGERIHCTDRHARLPQSVTSGLNLQPRPCDAKSSGQPFLIGAPGKSIAWRVALTFASELMSLMNRCPGFRFATSPNWLEVICTLWFSRFTAVSYGRSQDELLDRAEMGAEAARSA